jgi:hypothetical protein
VIRGSAIRLVGGRRMRRLLLAGLAMTLLAAGVGGCAASPDMEGMPAEAAAAPLVVRQAYAFAATHPDVMSQIPCYCGCGSIGHTSNYACYVSDVDSEGSITYDLHALGCSICVDITRDTQRLLDEGRSVSEIRAEIDNTYSPFGPSNLP